MKRATTLSAARVAALETLQKVEVDGLRADVVLNRFCADMDGNQVETALAKELCYGVFRWRYKLDYILSGFYRGKLDRLSPWIRNILRLGAYQLLFLDRVPPWAALDESVKLAHRYGHRGTAGLVNGVLRSISREGDRITYPPLDESAVRHISVGSAHPEWLVTRWIERLGVDETIRVCSANNQKAPLTVRANTLRTAAGPLAESLMGEGIRVVECSYAANGVKLFECGPPDQTDAFGKGMFQVQDEASMLASLLVSPKEGMKVLDCCAGLGGKATFIAEAMGGRGTVVALDISYRRLSMLKDNCNRLGISNVYPLVMDSSQPINLPGLFDAVLVDAPCSDLGVMHRHPDIKWKREESDLLRFQKMQLRILGNAARIVKPGGALVYSTCTVEPEENDEVINAFLYANKCFKLESAHSFLPPQAAKFVTSEGLFHTFPDRDDMDGFFAARMKKC